MRGDDLYDLLFADPLDADHGYTVRVLGGSYTLNGRPTSVFLDEEFRVVTLANGSVDEVAACAFWAGYEAAKDECERGKGGGAA